MNSDIQEAGGEVRASTSEGAYHCCTSSVVVSSDYLSHNTAAVSTQLFVLSTLLITQQRDPEDTVTG